MTTLYSWCYLQILTEILEDKPNMFTLLNELALGHLFESINDKSSVSISQSNAMDETSKDMNIFQLLFLVVFNESSHILIQPSSVKIRNIY